MSYEFEVFDDRQVPGRRRAQTRVVDDPNDDYIPPKAVHVEGAQSVQDCPFCEKAMAKHSTLELLRCSQGIAADEDADLDAARTRDRLAKTLEATRAERRLIYSTSAPAMPTESEAALERTLERRRLREEGLYVDPDPPLADADGVPISPVVAEPVKPPPAPEPPEEDRIAKAKATIEAHSRTDYIEGVPTVVRLEDGTIDLQELARAMRTVIETERDEMVKRGGPIEKQNIELKNRLADMVEEAQKWRGKYETALNQRNSYKEQLDEQIRVNRQLRNKNAPDRSGERPKVVELKDIINVVSKTPGFEVRRQGNGHYGVYKNGVFVIDLASSGQGNKVNMASRVALKKAGVHV